MQITYKNKVTLQNNPNIPDENKVTAEDMNEIKSVVNSNEEEQQALNLSVQEIAQNVVNNSQEISNLKEEQTTQNENIQSNSNNISDLQLNKADKTEIPTDLSQLSNDNTKFVNETELENAIFQEKTQRQNADNNLQNQVDTNKTNIQTNATNIATNTQEINRIKAEQTTQNNRLNNLETDNTTNKSNISANTQEINNIKQEQTTQNTNIQINADNISALTSRVTETEEDISDIKEEQTTQNTNISTNATNIETLQAENEKLKSIVAQMPQVEGQGTSITLENTIEAPFTIFDVEGNSTQDGTPSPDNEVPILSSGDNGTINENISNKNLFDKDKAKNVDYYIELTTGSKVTQMGCMMSDFILVKENTSYVRNKKNDSNGNTFFASLNFYDKNKNYISGLWFSDNTFTTPAGTRYINLFSVRNRTNNENEEFVQDFMVEPGTTATPYVPHEEQDYSIPVQQPMRSIGDVRDCFVNVNGNWFERHYIARKIFDGTEEWGQNGSTASTGQYVIATTDKKYGILNLLSNSFVTKQTSTENSIAGRAINRNIYITIDLSIVEFSVAKFKAYLAEKYASGKSVYVDYELEEPLDLPCTEEQIEALENLPSTYKDFTIIQSEDETEAYLEVSGIYDLNKLITRTEVLESES